MAYGCNGQARHDNTKCEMAPEGSWNTLSVVEEPGGRAKRALQKSLQ